MGASGAEAERGAGTDRAPEARREANALRREAAAALQECLREVPGLAVEELSAGEGEAARGADLLLRLRWAEGPERLLVAVVLPCGEPRWARRAADRLFYLTQRVFPGASGLFIAPQVSARAAAICAEDGFGHLDLAGNCRLAVGPVFIHREGKRSPRPSRRLRSLFSPKAERVLRLLLLDPSRWWTLPEAAAAAGVSLGLAHNVRSLLHEREWLEVGRRGMRLADPEALLREWAGRQHYREWRRRDYYVPRPLHELEAGLAEASGAEGLRYALTAFAGAARLAPYARYQRVHAWLPEGAERLARRLGARPVDSGANLVLLEPRDDGVLHGALLREGVWIAAPVQLYLDLHALPGRGPDAAEFLFHQLLKPQWSLAATSPQKS